jgi:transposase
MTSNKYSKKEQKRRSSMPDNVKRVTKKYTKEYKLEAIKLIKEIGNAKAAKELGIAKSTLSQWMHQAEIGEIDTGAGSQTPGSAMTQAMEIQRLRAEVKALTKDNARLKKENDFLEEASAFFAASRQKYARKSE